MAKHQVFLIHGMGNFDKDWSLGMQRQLKDIYASYTKVNNLRLLDDIEFVEIIYNNIFEKWRWGVSLVAAYTDEPTGKKWSSGLMLHIGDGYNIALTSSDGKKWGLLLNLNLADRYFGGAQKVDSYLKCLKKPDPWQLLQGQDSCD